MNRFAPLVATAFLVLACATTQSTTVAPQPPPPPPAPPVECPPSAECVPMGDCPTEPTTARIVEIEVDRNGNATPSCVSIQRGNSVVVWTGGRDVARLEVRFKASIEKTPPKDPDCEESECILGKAKHRTKDGHFLYGICVTREDGTKAYCDPKLIINR